MAQSAAEQDASATAKYFYFGQFNRAKFREAFTARFSSDPRHDLAAIPAMEQLLGFIESDTRMCDIRWMAYMLATVFKETTTPKSYAVPVRDKKGKQKVDAGGNPVTRNVRRWTMTMAPVEEVGHGKGKDYHASVKVKRQQDGSAHVIEQDGDTFTVRCNDKRISISRSKGAVMGSAPGGQAAKAYNDDDGSAYSYFGRGYVQLTWWSNYASIGAGLGYGLELLFDPEKVEEPAIGYAIMSHGMITGAGFANGKTFSQYFHGAHTDYLGARAMVNGIDCREEIAGFAEKFEAILLASKVQTLLDFTPMSSAGAARYA